ncbi:YcnI family protein [Blastococcus sp. CCUG 61487]|uniref:YcnI family protein n=1 Tax=Blastococcus sp. CCUG 61487 TaxID=1840703 RepID=UPI0010BFA0FB|nr:YcnI family protein [Blastococcus sp. CCUG 61487]TKJ35179.1 nuclear export factor GLE1 [Blastococcus sp. CCUG 61487]
MSMSRSRVTAVLAAALLALVASVSVASTAAAHVTVSSADASPGGYGKLVFRVPNESDVASTVGLRIQIPEEAAMPSLRYQPTPGWEATLTTADLAEPIESHGREITSYVSVVEFRATGEGIAPGEFQEFALSGGPFPDSTELSFPSVQTYSDGSESAWIEPTVNGEEPERPSPVLTLGAADSGDDGAAVSNAGAGSDAAEADADDDSTAGIALAVAIVALLGAIAAVVLGVRAGRRTVSS